MADFQDYSVQVFDDVNDTPVAPTASAPGNGSHFIRQYNYLVSDSESEINSLRSDVQEIRTKLKNAWVVIEEDYAVQGGEKIFFKNNQPIFPRVSNTLYIPTNPPLGTTFSYISYNSSISIELKTYDNVPLNIGMYSKTRVYSTVADMLISFLFVGAGFNWYQIAGTPVLTTQQSS